MFHGESDLLLALADVNWLVGLVNHYAPVTVRLLGYSTDWLTACLSEGRVEWLTDWLTDWPVVDELIHGLSNGFTNWPADCMGNR